MTGDPVVVVPGDLDVEDRLVGPVTFRMAGWLAAAAAGVALVATGRGAVAPTALGIVLAVVGLGGAWWRPGGRPAGAWLAPLLAYRRRRRHVPPTDMQASVSPEQPSCPEPPTVPDVEVARPVDPRRRQRMLVLPLAVAVIAVVAAAHGFGSRGQEEPAAIAPVPAPPRDPVVVVVPVDPFAGWEVGGGGLFDPSCGC